jgi:hypothetical protein
MTMGDFVPDGVKLSKRKYEVIVVVKTGVNTEITHEVVKI